MPPGKLAAIVAIAAIVTGTAVPALAQSNTDPARCSAEIDAAIAKLGMDRSKVSAIKNEPVLVGRTGSIVSGYRAWLSSNSCKGSFVINLQANCSFIDTFQRGDCTVDSFK